MMEILTALLGFNPAIINRGRVVWRRVVVRSIIVALVLLLVGSLANYWGWKGLSLFFAFAVGVIGIILALRPEGLIYTAELGILSGIASQPETVRQDVRRFLDLYVQEAARILFWKSGILFILGTISIKENPWAVLGILAAATVIFSYTVGYNPKMVIARRVVYGYACFMLVMLIFSLVPRHTWIRLTGADVKGFFASTEAEIGVSAVEKAEKEKLEEAKRIFLEGIERKVRQGVKLEDLSKGDLDLYRKLKKERDERSLSGKFSWLFESRKAKAEPAPPKPEPVRVVAPPVALPVTPPIVAPKPIEMPEWELCVEIKNRYARRDERCSRVSVEFKKYHREIVITEKYGVTTIYQGFQAGEKGEFEGPWSIQERNYTPGYGQFYLKFDPDSPWEYARGEKFHSKESYYITLKRIVLLREHE